MHLGIRDKKSEQETKRKILLKKTVTTTSSISSSELTISMGRDKSEVENWLLNGAYSLTLREAKYI